jgi:hypothetical protein
LAAPEVSARVQQSSADVRNFELAVKEIVEAWDRARRSLKDNPNLMLERAIWKDYFVQPEVLPRNVQTFKSAQKPSNN